MKNRDTQFYRETMEIVKKANIQQKFEDEVERILISGAIDMDAGCHRGILFGVALQNVAGNYVRGEEKSWIYKNLRKI